jgi:hypothetical protein
MDEQFLRRRWLDFRNGHSIYLAFVLTFVNFILISYNFAVKELVLKLPFLQPLADSQVGFALLFIAIYVPAAIIIGYWHRRNQYSVENEAMLKENWVWAWVMRYEIRLIQGKTTPEENEKMVHYLETILKRQKKDALITSDKLPPVPEFQDASEQRPAKNAS